MRNVAVAASLCRGAAAHGQSTATERRGYTCTARAEHGDRAPWLHLITDHSGFRVLAGAWGEALELAQLLASVWVWE
jgi:hypothetical protein